jgi:hypothetical protein
MEMKTWKKWRHGKNGNIYMRHGNIEKWRHGHMDIETWKWRHGHGDIDMETWTWRHGHGNIDMETWTWTWAWRHGHYSDFELFLGEN